MSPARIGRPVLSSTSPRVSQPRMVRRSPRDAALGLVADPRRVGQGQGSSAGAELGGLASGHSSTKPGSLARSVAWRTSASRSPRRLGLGQGEHGVDQRQHRRARSGTSGRAPRRGSAGRHPRRGGQALLHPAEVGEVGTLEAVDRLLLVADHEQGARPRWRRRRRRTPRSASRRSPTARARVLRLVDQDVVDPRVELEQHPLGLARGGAAARGALDQILVVERRPRAPSAPRRRRSWRTRRAGAPRSAGDREPAQVGRQADEARLLQRQRPHHGLVAATFFVASV